MSSMAYIFLAALLIPNEVFVSPMDVRIEPYKIVLLLYVFLNWRSVVGLFSNHTFRIAIFHCSAVFISGFYYFGFTSIESSFVYFLEFYVVVVLVYSSFNNRDCFGTFFLIIGFVFFVLFLFAVYEGLTGVRIFHIVAGELFGNHYTATVSQDYFRYGVFRASSVFSHPILYGVVCASVLPLYIYFSPKGGMRTLGVIGFLGGVFASMSTVGFLMLAIQGAMFIYIRKGDSLNLTHKLIVFLPFLIIFNLFSNQGFIKFMVSNFTLNPQTAYVRIAQWGDAFSNIIDNPIVGVGYKNDWSRAAWLPSSIDSYWLFIVVTYGLPSLFLLTWFFYRVFSAIEMISITRMRIAVYLSAVSIVFAGFTVHFFDRGDLFIFFLTGVFLALSSTSFDFQARSENPVKLRKYFVSSVS